MREQVSVRLEKARLGGGQAASDTIMVRNDSGWAKGTPSACGTSPKSDN